MMKYILTLIMMSIGTIILNAQNTMRIHLKDGTPLDIPLENVDSISFIEVEQEQTEKATIVGTWYWESKEDGYSETLTFNADGSFFCVAHYFSLGFETNTYGFYNLFGSTLKLWTNGYGIGRFQHWMIAELNESKMTVLTRMGSFTYEHKSSVPSTRTN